MEYPGEVWEDTWFAWNLVNYRVKLPFRSILQLFWELLLKWKLSWGIRGGIMCSCTQDPNLVSSFHREVARGANSHLVKLSNGNSVLYKSWEGDYPSPLLDSKWNTPMLLKCWESLDWPYDDAWPNTVILYQVMVNAEMKEVQVCGAYYVGGGGQDNLREISQISLLSSSEWGLIVGGK